MDFCQVQMLDFPSRQAFEGNAQHALDLFEMLRMQTSQITKEAVILSRIHSDTNSPVESGDLSHSEKVVF